MADVILDAIHDPYKARPEGEIILGQIAKEFWLNATKTATKESQKQFTECYTDHLEFVVVQARDRDRGRLSTVDEYFVTRRENIGARPSYMIGVMHLSLSDETFLHPDVKEMERLNADLIFIDNDIGSYNKEQGSGDDQHNILTIAMNQFGFNLQSYAVDSEATRKHF